MSFRDNLQHLRDTRNMTQSELAMLVGVSRQSVAKWEAEKSYPEMDKLLKLCDLFECTLDDLVRGDLTGRAPDPTRSLPEDAPPVDACGYDEHMRRRAWTVPAGLAMFVAGFGVAIAFSNMNGANPGARPYIAYFACATVGFALLIRAFAVHGSFRRRHPYIEDFYTDDQRVAARKEGKRSAVGGLVLLCASLFFASPGAIALADTLNLWGLMANVWNVYGTLPLLLFALLAASVALLVHAAMVVCLINVVRYNRDSERKAEAASHLVAAMQARLAQSAGAAETGAGADADTPSVSHSNETHERKPSQSDGDA